jgi:hypothetical protein
MFATAIRRAAQASQPSLAQTAPVSRLKKVWPPDFSKLSPGEQLKFEKRYKRRVRLAAARPLWNKVIKLTQLFSITCMGRTAVEEVPGICANSVY